VETKTFRRRRYLEEEDTYIKYIYLSHQNKILHITSAILGFHLLPPRTFRRRRYLEEEDTYIKYIYLSHQNKIPHIASAILGERWGAGVEYHFQEI